jgi:predicted transposase/invertase (TIGR01784 family)
MKYLDPKNDLTFRKIFGEHPKIMMSFLNSMLPLDEGQVITSLTYADPALIPELPELKHSVVDVRCTDNFQRQFIVEMQMYWSSSFKNRMLFNAGKAYVKQIDSGQKYSELRPVYGLSLVNENFLTEKEQENQFYHHYRLAHQEMPQEIIKGIELIFIELPKFKVQNFSEKKLRYLWLRFLTEIDENTTDESIKDLKEVETIREALEYLQVSAFSKGELEYYDKYWDRVRIERSAIEDALKKAAQSKALLEQTQAQMEQTQAQMEQTQALMEQTQAKMEQTQAKMEQERILKQAAELKANEAELKANEAKANAEQYRIQKEEAMQHNRNSASVMKSAGISIHIISQTTGLSPQEIENL